MKTWKILLAGFLIVSPVVLTCCMPNGIPSGAVFLGKREVDFGMDRDVIAIPRSVGPLHRLIVVAPTNPVEVYNIRVVFGNGGSEDYNVREKLFSTRDRLVVDLPGNSRVVREVVFRYRTLDNAARRAVVELWGI